MAMDESNLREPTPRETRLPEPTLPPDLRELERRLAALPAPEPPASLRGRVAIAVAEELRRERARSRWAFTGGVAAAAAIILNLSMSAGLLTGIDGHRSASLPSLSETVAVIRDAVPEISERDALREAAVLVASRVSPPALPTLPTEALRRYVELLETRGD